MARLVIDDKIWNRLVTLLPQRPKGGRPGKDNRLFIEAVCWIIRTGVPWRDLPIRIRVLENNLSSVGSNRAV